MYHFDGHLFSGKLLQRVTEGLHRTVHVTLDDDVEFLEVTECQPSADFIECNVFLRADTLFTHDLCTPVGYLFGFRFIIINLEFLTSLRCTIQTEDQYR